MINYQNNRSPPVCEGGAGINIIVTLKNTLKMHSNEVMNSTATLTKINLENVF